MEAYNFKKNSLELLRLESRIRKLKRYKAYPVLLKSNFLIAAITPFTGLLIGILLRAACSWGNDYAYQNLEGAIRYIIAAPTLIGGYLAWIFIIAGALFLFAHWDQVKESWIDFLHCDAMNEQNAKANQQNAAALSEASARHETLQAELLHELTIARENRSREFDGLNFFFEIPFDPLENTVSLNDNINNRPDYQFHSYLFGIPNLHTEEGVPRLDGMLQNLTIEWSRLQSYLNEDKYILLYLDADYILEHKDNAQFIINPVYDVIATPMREIEYSDSSINVQATMKQFNQSVDNLERELLGVSVSAAEALGTLSETDAARLNRIRKSEEQYLQGRLEDAAAPKHTGILLTGEQLLFKKRCYIVEHDGRIVCIAIPKEINFFVIEYNLDEVLRNENALFPTEEAGRYRGVVSLAANLSEGVSPGDIPHTIQFVTERLNHMLSPFTPLEQPPADLPPRMWRWWISLRYSATFEQNK